MICSCKVPGSFFFQTSPSLLPLPYIFGADAWEAEVPSYSHSSRPALQSVETCWAHFPTRAFKTSSRGHPAPSWAVQALSVYGLYWFSMYPEEYWPLFLSLPLFSPFSFSWDQPTPGQRPFAIWPPSIHHEFSPDPVAQVSSDGTLGRHRPSSFLGSQGTLRPFFLFVRSRQGHALEILCQKRGDIWGPLTYSFK